MRLPASRAPALSSPPFTFLFAHIYITQRHVLQKERRLTMKIPNTSETRIVSHTLRFKSCPANTKDQPKREAQVNKEKLKPQAHCISLTLSPTKALLLLLYFFFFFFCIYSFTCLQVLLFMLALNQQAWIPFSSFYSSTNSQQHVIIYYL